MAYFADEWIHELLSRINIADLVGEYVTLQNKGGRLWACCPFHNEKTPSFTVNPDKGFFHCFGCGKGGNAIHFVMEQDKLTFPEACAYLAEKVDLAVPENTDNRQYEARKAARKKNCEMNKAAALYFHKLLYSPAGSAALEYLKGRGINDRIVKTFGLGFSGNDWDGLMKLLEKNGFTKQEMSAGGLIKINEGKSYDLFRNRVMMPIINTFGDVIGFGGRVMDDGMPKYLNSPETAAFSKSRNLYNLNIVRRQKDVRSLVLVEGYMDVIALYMHGVQNCVATLGTALTQDQARLIKRYVSSVYISYDGDEAGKKATLRALSVLSQEGIESRVISIPGGQDPDDFLKKYGKEGYVKLMKAAKPELDYRFDVAAAPYDLSDGYQKERYTKDCIAILKSIGSAVVKEKYVRKLSERTGFSENSIMQDLGMAEGEKPEYKSAPKKAETGAAQRAEDGMMAALCTQPDRALSIEKYILPHELCDEVNRKIYSYLLDSAKKGFLPRGDEILSMLELAEDINKASALLELAAGGDERTNADSYLTDCVKRVKIANKERELAAMQERSRGDMDAETKKRLGAEISRLSKELYELRQSAKGE